jgi:hypothetical protein
MQLKDILKEKHRAKGGHNNAPAHRALAIQKTLTYL